MILYHASTSYHVLCCIVHKLAYHKEEKATFMIVEHMLPKEKLNAFINKLNSFQWFDEIISVPESSFRLSHGKTLNMQSSEKDIFEVIQNISRVVEKWYPSGFQKFDNIYLASDQWSVGVYLLYHKIPHHYFEDASGMLGDQERYLNIVKSISVTNYVIINYLNGAGRSENVIDKLCDMRNQPKGFKDDKAVDFSIYHIVRGLSANLVENLLNLYGAKQYKINSTEKVVVFMTQFIKTLTLQNLDVQERITTLLLDYFACNCKLIIKPHPKDRGIDYHKLLPEAIVLEKSLPSELLPFILVDDMDLILTASSTSIGGMLHIAKKAISFGTDIEIHYDRLHEMYITAKVINEVFEGQKIITRDIISSHLENFLSMYTNDFSEKDSYNGSIYVDGGLSILGKSSIMNYTINQSDDILIFLNYNQRFEFLQYPGLDHTNFIVITNNQRKDIDIWIYCENEEARRKIMEINERKLLKYSGIEMEISTKEATQIMILNGKMKAIQYALKQKESEEQNQVISRIKEVITQYQNEEVSRRILLGEEGILHE